MIVLNNNNYDRYCALYIFTISAPASSERRVNGRRWAITSKNIVMDFTYGQPIMVEVEWPVTINLRFFVLSPYLHDT